jgi:hypothetical protein
MIGVLHMLSRRTLVFSLTLLVLAAVITSSCGFTLTEASVTESTQYADSTETEGEFCNCHLKAEIDHLTTAPAITVPAVELVFLDLPSTTTVVADDMLVVAATALAPPDHASLEPPHRTWPVPLARAHL